MTKVFFQNSSTGELAMCDNSQQRLFRLRRRLSAWARAINKISHRVVYKGLLLTYKNVDDWEPNHIRDFMNTVKEHLGQSLIAYAWVAELQQRGAVHYHVALVLDKGVGIPYPDKAGWWVHGYTGIQTLKFVSSKYLIKYIQKGFDSDGQSHYPKGLRIFAVVINKSAGLSDGDMYWFRRSAGVTAVRKVLDEITLFTGWWDQLRARRTDKGWGIFLGKIMLREIISDWVMLGTQRQLLSNKGIWNVKTALV